MTWSHPEAKNGTHQDYARREAKACHKTRVSHHPLPGKELRAERFERDRDALVKLLDWREI